MKNLNNYHAIIVKYLPATNTQPSRVRLSSPRFKQSIIITFDYSLNTCEEMAIHWLTKNGHKIHGIALMGDNESNTILLSPVKGSFKSLKPLK